MELQEIEIRAANLEPLPGRNELDWYEQNLFLALRNIYRMYHAGVLNKEAAAKEKRVVLAAYQKQREMASLIAADASLWAEGVQKSQSLRIAINRAESMAEKGRLALECVAALTGDEAVVQGWEALHGGKA